MLKMFFRGPSTQVAFKACSSATACCHFLAWSMQDSDPRSSSLARENPPFFDMKVLSHSKRNELSNCQKMQVQNTQDAVVKSTDTSLDSPCKGMKVEAPNLPDRIAPLVQLLPEGCVHTF